MIKPGSVTALASVALVGSLVALGGCREKCDDCGQIASINSHVEQGQARPGGTIAGAIIGGVIGHQFGSGHGRDAATAVGAVGGAVVGNQIEKDRARYLVYDLAIRMDKGGIRHVTISALGGLKVGDEVEIRDGQVVPRDMEQS